MACHEVSSLQYPARYLCTARSVDPLSVPHDSLKSDICQSEQETASREGAQCKTMKQIVVFIYELQGR